MEPVPGGDAMTSIRVTGAALCLMIALGGCAGKGTTKPAGRPTTGARAGDGFPKGWEVDENPAGSADARKAAAFPEGWELPEEIAARGVSTAAAPAAGAALSATAAVSSTVSAEAELVKARTQVGKAGNMLGRLKATGYQVLVKDDLQAIEGLLEEARGTLAAGNAPETRRLADEAARRLQKAKTRIEAETQQPLRW